jgi:hypothetical protein
VAERIRTVRELNRTTLARQLMLERKRLSPDVALVTPRDYALIRAALSETNFPWESQLAKRLAPSVRSLAAAGPVTSMCDVPAYRRRSPPAAGQQATSASGSARWRPTRRSASASGGETAR